MRRAVCTIVSWGVVSKVVHFHVNTDLPLDRTTGEHLCHACQVGMQLLHYGRTCAVCRKDVPDGYYCILVDATFLELLSFVVKILHPGVLESVLFFIFGGDHISGAEKRERPKSN